MMSENPWLDITPPSIADTVNARRVSAELPWNFFWARDADSRVLLTLTHSRQSAPSNPLPKLRDIEVSLSPPDTANSQILLLKLLDTSQMDIFHTLCQDIMDATSDATTEAEAVSITLMRTWRWHHLLRGGSDVILSPMAQRGLLGELLTLERFMLPNLEPSTALTAWLGPLDAPKDFEIGRVAVEVKARRGGGTSSVRISSEDQLDESGVDLLFMYVIELNEVSEDAEDAMTIQDVADRIRRHLGRVDPGVLDIYESLLLAAGLRSEHDYSCHQWLEGSGHIYLVADEFPRIVHHELRSGVSLVGYTISLGDCEPFMTSASTLVSALMDMGEPHGN